MPEMESPEHEDSANLTDQVEQQEDHGEPERRTSDEQGARSFFALLSFLLAVLCLAAFINRALDNFTGLLVLFGFIIFGIIGFLLLDKKLLQPAPCASTDTPHSTSVAAAPAMQHALYNAHENDAVNFEGDEGTETQDDDYTEEDEGDESAEVNDVYADDDGEEDEGEGEEDEDDDELSAFKHLVEEALDSIPPEFQAKMENLAVLVASEPGAETLRSSGAKEGYTLLGLYQGVPLTAQGHSGSPLPETITLYQRPLERYCHGDPDRMREQVRRTLIHEVAHHFGIDHDDMPIWVR